MKKLLLVTLAMFLIAPISAQAQNDADKEAVRQAVLDYVEGIYNVEPARIVRSDHPDLAKLGFARRRTETAYQPGEKMTFQQLVEIAKTYNKAGRLPKARPSSWRRSGALITCIWRSSTANGRSSM